ncbi:hypothetical protein [Brassicibacter mesophilus]|uniref:hypothetical protein n=1 Tax=Brassicibacter mesophilus TaxID=745119 RepID=UPI003D23E17C
MINRYILVGILIIFVIYSIFTSAIPINKELPAVKYKLGGEGIIQNTIIKIGGKYRRSIFSSDVFIDTIYIEGC